MEAYPTWGSNKLMVSWLAFAQASPPALYSFLRQLLHREIIILQSIPGASRNSPYRSRNSRHRCVRLVPGTSVHHASGDIFSTFLGSDMGNSYVGIEWIDREPTGDFGRNKDVRSQL